MFSLLETLLFEMYSIQNKHSRFHENPSNLAEKSIGFSSKAERTAAGVLQFF